MLSLLLPSVHAEVAVPALSGRVVDLTGTLSGGAVNRIEAQLAQLEEQKGSQLAVLIVPTTQPEDIEQFGIRVADQWKLGRKGVDDGAILIVAKNDRTVRIEVGRGLEGALSDAIANRIIDETITPRFRQGDFDGGVQAGITQMIAVVNGESLPPPDQRWQHRPVWHGPAPLVLLIFAFYIASMLRAVFGRWLGALLAGGLIGGVLWLVVHVLAVSAVGAAIGFFIALLGGSSGRWSSGGGRGGPFIGGFGGGGFGGSSGGGFSGGGFSGGGGGFAGGGASGRW
jgi:uncharacterized protein